MNIPNLSTNTHIYPMLAHPHFPILADEIASSSPHFSWSLELTNLYELRLHARSNNSPMPRTSFDLSDIQNAMALAPIKTLSDEQHFRNRYFALASRMNEPFLFHLGLERHFGKSSQKTMPPVSELLDSENLPIAPNFITTLILALSVLNKEEQLLCSKDAGFIGKLLTIVALERNRDGRYPRSMFPDANLRAELFKAGADDFSYVVYLLREARVFPKAD